MISSNTRATRSRYSSPAQQHNGSGQAEGPRATPNDSSKLFMKRWLEPSMQSKPSFEEAGLARHGVVETMLPLGAMPKKKAMQENGPAVKRIILRPSGAKTANSTAQEPTPGPRTPAQDAKEKPATAALSPPPRTSPQPTTSVRLATRASLGSRGKGKGQVDENEDDEYDPKGSLRRRQPARPSVTKKGRPSAADRRNSLISVKASPINLSSAKTSPVKQGTSSAIPGASHDADFTKKVVEAAIDEALKHYRYPTAWALRKLYDEKADDAQFVAMIEDVFSQTADSRTMEEFFAQVEEKKREGKKGNRGCYHFFPPATNSRYTPHKPKPSPYSHLLERPVNDDDDDGGGGNGEDNGEDSRPVKRIKVIHHSSTTPRKKVATGAKGVSGVSGSLRTPTSRKRVRRDSGSSESSLSSVMSLSSPEESHMASHTSLASPSLRVSAKAASRAGATVRIQSQPKGDAKPGPISTSTTRTKVHRQGAVASDGPSSGSGSASSGNNSSYSTTSSSSTSRSASASKPPAHHRTHQQHHRQHQHSNTTATKSAADDASMPGRLVASETPTATATTTKIAVHASSAAEAHMTEEQDGFWTRRRDAKRITNDYAVMESDVRNGDDERVATPARRSRRTRQSLAAPTSTRSTRSASKRVNDDDERTASPGVFSTQGDGSSVPGSRATTPTNLRPAKKHKSGLRIKLSPVKKKGGTAAGVPRSMGDAQSSAASANAGAKDQADNDECCSACGNAGDVVCCDGCPRSFHFECVDMVQSEDLPDEWYCNECIFRKFPSRMPVHKGVFASALNSLEKSIPRAFSLPKKIQNRFEGVKAGADGDYEEISSSKANKKKSNGYDEAPDFFKQREDGEAVLCHNCQKAATDVRAIIPCSVCPMHWHLDCLDPPLALPPVLKTWRCPAHADDLLVGAAALAPAHRFRKIKGASIITPSIGRGLKNNGHVEIDWSEEPEEPDNSGWRELSSFGRVYKIPAKGVVLDFIEQLRNQGAGHAPQHDEPRRLEPYLTPPVEDVYRPLPVDRDERNLEEMQTSLILTSLKKRPAEGVEQLTSALLASAEPNVISLIAQGNADNISRSNLIGSDEISLRALLAQMETMSSSIRQLLGEKACSPAHVTLMNQEAGSSFEDSKSSTIKMDTEQLVTEPTPPSTIDHVDAAMDYD